MSAVPRPPAATPARRRGVKLAHALIAALGFALLLVAAGTFRITLEHMRRFLTEQLVTHAQDAATSLGLSMSTSMAANDPVMMQSMVDAVFDSGYFRSIRVRAVDGTTIADRASTVHIDTVPDWFVRAVPLETPVGEAKVMSGWTQYGTVSVRSHPGHAYAELWGNSITMLVWTGATLVLVVAFIGWVVHLTLAPLRALERQARAVMTRQPMPRQELPVIRDLHGPIAAMNLLAGKVDRMLEGLSARVQQVRRRARTDEATGLGNAYAFERALEDLGTRPEQHLFGACALLQVQGLEEVNKREGYAAGDALLRSAAATLAGGLPPGATLARLGGGLFAAVLTDVTLEQARAAVAQALERLAAQRPAVHAVAGIAAHYPGRDGARLLDDARAALARARERGGLDADPRDAAQSGRIAAEIEAIEHAIANALAHDALMLHWQPVRTADGSRVMQYEALSRIGDGAGGLMPAIGFVALLAREGSARAFDQQVIETVLGSAAVPADGRLAVNLTRASAQSAQFAQWLDAALARAPRRAARLDVECGEQTIAAQPDRVLDLARVLQRHGARFGVDHLAGAELSFAYMSALRVDYVKLDPGLTRRILGDTAAQETVAECVNAAAGAEIAVIAQAVEEPAQWQRLAALGVAGVQGLGVGAPAPVEAPAR